MNPKQDSELSQEAQKFVDIGRLLGCRVNVRKGNNGRTWRKGYGRCKAVWDYPLKNGRTIWNG